MPVLRISPTPPTHSPVSTRAWLPGLEQACGSPTAPCPSCTLCCQAECGAILLHQASRAQRWMLSVGGGGRSFPPRFGFLPWRGTWTNSTSPWPWSAGLCLDPLPRGFSLVICWVHFRVRQRPPQGASVPGAHPSALPLPDLSRRPIPPVPAPCASTGFCPASSYPACAQDLEGWIQGAD